MSLKVICVRHGDEPEDDRATAWLEQAGYSVETRRPFKGETLGPVTEDVAATIVYGGRFNVYETDEHPFLAEEYRWIDACLAADVPMLGICQGAQQIAHLMGAWVGARSPEQHEFGYYEITPTAHSAGFLDGPLTVSQWHFHTFDLWDGAVRLAQSAQYENQAFRYGDRTFGVQFHPEITPRGFRRWQDLSRDGRARPGEQDRAEQDRLMALHDTAQAAWFEGFLDRWIGPTGRDQATRRPDA